MQQPMESYVCGINKSSGSTHYVLFAFRVIDLFLSNSGTTILWESKLDKTKNFLTSNLYHKRRNAKAVA